MSEKNNTKLLVAADFEDVFAAPFKNDRERIKYMSRAYKGHNLAKSFSIFYGLELDNSLKTNKSVNFVNRIELGKVYAGNVKEFTKNSLIFDLPGVKEEIIAKDNFTNCIDEINAYLATHNNKLLFEVREKKNNKYYVSVIQGYYRTWVDKINKAIEQRNGITVHIDELVKGGYVCHTNISELSELTGKTYTHSVFIPGSQIVLNIERDFEHWIGQDVLVVPQKFTEFVDFHKKNPEGFKEYSLVSSRKLVLQIMGMKNMYEIYNDAMLKQKLAEANPNVEITKQTFDGTVTGILYSANKTGVFVELNDKYITGLLPVDGMDLAGYHPGDSVSVKINEFEIQEGKEPFTMNKKGTAIYKCNVRPIFEIA